MLISYPILPTPAAKSGETELEAFIGKYVDTTQGLYPVSLKDRWHGGIHLKPGDAPVRAIADGEVVAYRVAATPETYKNQDFDTSFVLLKHTTETGEKTPVVFYSLYMHLRSRRDLKDPQLKQLPDWLQKAAPGADVKSGNGQLVWRKDVLGFGGQLYGDRHVHFEIFAPDIDAFWKDSKALAQGANGSDDFFGDAYFVVPPKTHFLATHPHAQKHKDKKLYVSVQEEAEGEEGWSGGEISGVTPVPVDIALGGLGTKGVSTDGRLFVCIRYDKGKRVATSFQINANSDVEQIGPPAEQDDYEYNLYPIAKTLYPDCPSAGYEWLRFGRVLGPDTTTHQENWQYVRYGKDADAVGYVDLAAANITKLSDADFPFWQGWQTIDDDKSVIKEDGICDASALRALLGIPTDKQGQSLLDPPDFVANANDPATARKLQHLICKFNSEWDDSDVDTRYKRLYQTGQPLESTASQDDFKKHVKKMAFWSSTGLPRSVWHFHPLQFIEHYRKCGWRHLNEMAQLLPRNPGHGAHSISWNDAKSVSIGYGEYYLPINATWRKYGINSPERQALFVAQIYTETALLNTMTEFGNGAYNSRIPMTRYYAAFYGRGMLQMTWAGTYATYGTFRNFPSHTGPYVDHRITATSRHDWAAPTKDRHGTSIRDERQWSPRYDPDIVSSDDFNACDSAGFFWVSKHFMGHSDISRIADQGITTDTIGQANVLINGGGNGYDDRIRYAIYTYRVLSDSTDTKANESVTYSQQSLRSVNHHLAWAGGSQATTTIDFTPQRP